MQIEQFRLSSLIQYAYLLVHFLMSNEPCRVLVFGAHPDDAEFFAGGLIYSHTKQGSVVRLVSVTNGQSGHHELSSDALVLRRREEAARAAAVLGCEVSVWDYPDGYLTASLAVRESIIREIREFSPDLVLTHRPWDYHPDHRAVGQAVQDASYMVMVPKIVPGTRVPVREPVVASMVDLFTKPVAFQADFVLDATPYLDGIISMLSEHRSQFAEWLPWIGKLDSQVSVESPQWVEWLKGWYLDRGGGRAVRYWKSHWGERPKLVEAFEISEYAGRLSHVAQQRLFPGCIAN